MQKLEVYFDYTCPYCLRGHEYLLEQLPHYPDLAVEWRPCEAHPRPENHGRHSDLCARGMYIALENGADLMEYHSAMYRAALKDYADIEDLNILLRYTEGILNREKFKSALSNGLYEDRLLENNRLAWDEYDFPAVPSYKMGEKMLKSQLGVGVGKEQLAAFIRQYYKSI
ncbi:MAG: DsbA family protein [Oscillospiraceae bacterium]|nr:DsbA family protein [Oscillospiraceae bacterium]